MKSVGALRWLAVTVAFALMVGWTASRLLEVSVGEKSLSGLEWGADAPTPTLASSPSDPLELRLVDAGGVGIPADTAGWGGSYSHATDAFDAMILGDAPWVDGARFDRIRSDWRSYLARMTRYGNNAVVLDAFLELIEFERIEGAAVYEETTRAQHRAIRDAFATLIDDAREAGVGIYFKTDLPAVTSELEAYLRAGRLDAGDPAFWAVYAAGIDELFTALPDLHGMVIRIGEAGPLFYSDGSAYRSYLGVREPAQLRQMLGSLLPVFERHGKRMILRSWSIGVGPLGHLHHDPELYRAVLGDIDSPALVVSTKFVAGDYFGFLPLNPTLKVGRHARLIEMQARREFEGFGALPNFLAEPHRSALLQLRAANPNVIGMQLWTQEGGPLRAGPLSLYTVAGFWRWTDANVYATSRLAQDPAADPRALAEEWARSTLADDPDVARGMADLLMRSREALEKAIYIRPYATQRIDIAGVQAPPILWIFEWDVLGGWSSVLSTVYRSLGGDVDPAVAEGFEAVELTRAMQADLAALEPRLGEHPDWAPLVRSLAYQESLYETLAWYRATFLHYHEWLDRGGPERWRADADRFLSAATHHSTTYGRDLDFPAFDFAPAVSAVLRAGEGQRDRTAARILVAVLFFALTLGAAHAQRRTPPYPGKRWARALLIGSSSPWRLGDDHDNTAAVAWGIAGIAIAAAAVTAALALSIEILSAALALGALLLSYALALRGSWWRDAPGELGAPDAQRSHHAHHAPAVLTPLLLAAGSALAVMAIRGPDFFWYLFWTENAFRTLAFAVPAGLGLWTLGSSHALGWRVGGGSSFATGSLLIALGCSLLALSVLLPDLTTALAALDEPLQLLPMRPAIIHGITEYAGLSPAIVWLPSATGALLLIGGAVLRASGRRGRLAGR